MSVNIKFKTYFTKEKFILLGAVLLIYANSLKNDYSLDDSIVTEPKNITAKGISSIPEIIQSFYIGSSDDYQFDYRPIVKISFAIEHELFDIKPSTSHFINLVLYCIALLLLLKVLELIFQEYPKRIIFYMVLLFAMLPIHVEVVSSIKNRDILLCFIFCLLGLKKYYFFYESNFKKWKHLVIAILYLYLGFLSKYDALPFVVVIPLIFLIQGQQNVKWLILSIALFFTSLILFKVTKKGLVDIAETKRLFYYFENPMYFEKSFKCRIIALLNSLGFYISQCVYPFKQVCYYGYDTIPILKIQGFATIGLISVPLLIFGFIRSFIKKNVVVFTGLIMFCIPISMYLNFAKPAVGIVADRFTFFASSGFSIVIIGLIFNFLGIKNDLQKNVKYSMLIILIMFGFSIVARNRDWKNISTIIKADVDKYPRNAYLNYKYGINLVNEIEFQSNVLNPNQRRLLLSEARGYLEKSIEVEPNYPNSRNYLSYVLVYLLNEFEAALPHINKSLEFKETPELLFYKGIVFRETKMSDSSEYYLLKSIKVDSTFYNAYSLLMFDYNQAKNYSKSINLFKWALDKGVKTEQIYLGLASTYEAMRNNEMASRYYKNILKINPKNLEVQQKLKKLESSQ